MSYYGYKITNGKYDEGIELKTSKAVAKFVVSSMEDKIVTDVLDNTVLKTYGTFLMYLNPAYGELREVIIEEQLKQGM